jgi:uncharacterized protein YgbK (DUF1537 family)
VLAELRARQADGIAAVVCDAETEQDLVTLAYASNQLDTPAYWVGSGGLARALSTVAQVTRAATTSPVTYHQGPVLTMVGSMSGISGKQAAYLCERARMEALVVAPQTLRDGAGHPAWTTTLQSITTSLSAGRDLLLSIGRDDAFDPAEGRGCRPRSRNWFCPPSNMLAD